MNPQYLKSDLLMLLASLLAAISWIFSKEVLLGLEPILFMGCRFMLAGLLIALFARSELLLFTLRDLSRVTLVGVIFAAGLGFWILGLFHGTHIGIGAFLTSLGAIFAPLLAPLFGDQPTRFAWFAVPVAVIGAAFLTLTSNFVFGLGEWYYLASAISFAIYLNINSRAAGKTPLRALTSIQLLTAGAVLLPISLLTESWTINAEISILGWFLASVLIGTSLRFFVQTYSLKLGPASRGALILTLEPVWVAILGMIWLKETMSASQLLGCTLILLAVFISRADLLLKVFCKSKRLRRNGHSAS
ncbi:DMT family transporter [Marinobacterium sp. xm-d-530]|uniref:DMT family transporter n=1 Tax=Marinobacterium sp. xm-d-530 TaxID=2497747 RepID=UPI0015689561|nr:DMT family transporter [Marinobacterium sp. xm-d-530]NRQ02520.1 putative DMT superfamily transporter inner membrane protein [Marinobacterium sp. xm-d-530]